MSDESIASDSSGRIYAATPKGLFIGISDRYRLEPRLNGLPEIPVTAVHIDPQGALFFARGGFLYRRQNTNTTEFGRPRMLPETEPIDQIRTDRAGNLWVRTLQRLYVLPLGAHQFERDDNGLPRAVNSGRLALDHNGDLIVPTELGLARKVVGSWRLLGRSEGLEFDAVLSALVDREGTLWMGLAGAGLVQQIGHGSFTGWGRVDGLAGDIVWSIVRARAKGKSSALWVGTQTGLSRIDIENGSIRNLREEEGLGGNTVYALAASDDGSVWAGSWPGGVTRIGPEPGRIRRYSASGLPDSDFRVIALRVTLNGDVWAGARTGIYRLPRGSRLNRFELVNSLPGGDTPDSVYALTEDPNGILFGVGRYGLHRLTGPAPRRFRQADGMRADFIASISTAPDGSLVIGYREAIGADRVTLEGDQLKAQRIDIDAAASSYKVVLLGYDANQRLWLGSSSGVYIIEDNGKRIRNFGKADGLLSEDMSQNAFLAERDGTVWLGTSRGLVQHRPGPTPESASPPTIVLTECWGGARRLDLNRPTRLLHSENVFNVSWAGLTFIAPKKVRFRYRLVGLQDSYLETDRTEMRFPALPAGHYQFEVFAVSASGVPSAHPAVFTFEVLPGWREISWVWGGATLILVALGIGLVRLRTRALETDRRRLEAAVAERSAELAAKNRALEEASFTDPLTKLRNRRFFSMTIEEDVTRTLRAYKPPPGGKRPHQRDIIFYLIDLDYLKQVNDAYGHDAGDRVLIEVSRRLKLVVRQSDLPIRWGGDEFLIVSRDADRAGSDMLPRRILEALASQPFDLGDSRTIECTCSIGWAAFPWMPEEPEKLHYEQVLKIADRALYLAKQSGRNQSCGLTPEEIYVKEATRTESRVEIPVSKDQKITAILFRTSGPETAQREESEI